MEIKKIGIGVVSLFFSLCVSTIYAQNCDQTYYGAKELYNKGQFNRSLELLNPCIDRYKSNSEAAKNEQNQVFRLFKLYIASCNQAYRTKQANTARKNLAVIFQMSLDEVGQRLNNTSL